MAEPTSTAAKLLQNKIVQATTPSQSLIWQPLHGESIRVLRLCGKLSHYLVCTLESTQLTLANTQGNYHALSYIWGPPSESEKGIPILLNGEPTTIRPNLHAALLSIWSQAPGLLLWADALSINQADNTEKTTQVALMSDIYRRCRSVKVWLGKLDRLDWEPMRRAWETMNTLVVDASRSLAEIATCVFPENYDWRTSLTNSLLVLSENEWFYRAWTAQEIILAPTAEVWYGHLTMDWHIFEQGCKRIVNDLGLQPMVRNPWNEIERCRELADKPRPTMTELLVTTYRRRATDSRDKIFALIGFLPGGTYKADYSEGNRSAFIRVFKHCVTNDKSLMILELAQGVELPFDVSKIDEQLPEWAQIMKKSDRGKADHYCTTEQQYREYYWSDYVNEHPWDRKPLSWLPDFDNMQQLNRRMISSHHTRLIPRHTDPILIETAKTESIGLAGFVLGGLYRCGSGMRAPDFERKCWKLIPLTYKRAWRSGLSRRWLMQLPHTFDENFWPPPRGGDNADVLEDLKAWWLAPNQTRYPEPFHDEFDLKFEGSKHIEANTMLPMDAHDADWICILPGADKLCVLRPVVHEIVNDISLGNWLSNSKSTIRLEKFRFIGMIQSEICDKLTMDWLNMPVVWMNFFLM